MTRNILDTDINIQNTNNFFLGSFYFKVESVFNNLILIMNLFGENMAVGKSEDVAELLIEGIDEIIENISQNFMFSNKLDETSLSEDFMDDLLNTLEMARTELVNAFH